MGSLASELKFGSFRLIVYCLGYLIRLGTFVLDASLGIVRLGIRRLETVVGVCVRFGIFAWERSHWNVRFGCCA